tara:strand:- start:487 stop:999 length:513 start_codon:yes stop_codon:yes gene_type:complete
MSSGQNQRKYYPDEIGKDGLIGIFEGFTKEQKTQMGVAEAYRYYSRKGYMPHTPPPDLQKSGFDLLMIHQQTKEQIKVEAKTTGNKIVCKDGSYNYALGLKEGHFSSDNECMEGKTCRKTFSGFDELTLLDADGRFCIFTYDEIKNHKHSVHHKDGIVNPNKSQAIIDGV